MQDSSYPIERELPPDGYRMQSPDTEYWAEKLLFDRYREMTPAEKAAMLADASRWVQMLTMAGLRQRHPGLSEEQLELKAAALRVGREWVQEITGVDPDSLNGPDHPRRSS